MNILNRNSTTINIANFWENYQLKKYNFDPPYQRPNEVWGESKKSFLIDTILKNFPIPPIFLHQHIDESTGKTMYDVIDGKQRLTAILDFIQNKINTPDDFHSDGFGIPELSNVKFKDLDKPELSDWKKVFWRYDITVEFVDTDQNEVVNNIFDRLNRNGEPLTKQELRNARYYSSRFYQSIKNLAQDETLKPILDKLQRNRLEDEEFVTELLITTIKQDVIPGDNPGFIDEHIEEYSRKSEAEITEFENSFNIIVDFIARLGLDFQSLRIGGVSHFYAIWGIGIEILKTKTIDEINFAVLKQKLENFYQEYFTSQTDEHVIEYKQTMSAGTKSANRRKRRIDAVLRFCQ